MHIFHTVAEAAAVEESSSKSASSTCKQSGKLSATAIAFLVLCIVEVLAVVVLAKRLFGIKRKQRDKTAGEGGGEAEAGTAAKGDHSNQFPPFSSLTSINDATCTCIKL